MLDDRTLEHEQLLVRRGRRSGLTCVVAVHSTVRGPSLGGCRLWGYPTVADAVADALRLSRAMTLKSSAADLALGGGKGVIMAAAGETLTARRRRDALLDFADTVDTLGGRYITAEDVGTSSRDMSLIATRTTHVAGLARSRGGSGDPSPFTALGVVESIEATCRRLGAGGLRGRTVWSSASATSAPASPACAPTAARDSSSPIWTRPGASSPIASAPAGWIPPARSWPESTCSRRAPSGAW